MGSDKAKEGTPKEAESDPRADIGKTPTAPLASGPKETYITS